MSDSIVSNTKPTVWNAAGGVKSSGSLEGLDPFLDVSRLHFGQPDRNVRGREIWVNLKCPATILRSQFGPLWIAVFAIFQIVGFRQSGETCP